MTTELGTARPWTAPRRPVRVRRAPSISLSDRDLVIVRHALRKLGSDRFGFGDAVRALTDATEEIIPSGRCYLLGEPLGAPIIGSRVSGVGIVEQPDGGGIALVRRAANGQLTTLGSLASFAARAPADLRFPSSIGA